MGRNGHGPEPRVHVVGHDSPATRTVVEALERFEVERVPSVATLTGGRAASVVVVASAVGVSVSSAVERVRRAYGETPVVVVAREVPAVRADAVTPVDVEAIEETVRELVADERLEHPRRRIQRLATLAFGLNAGGDLGRLCQGLVDGGGYETAWIASVRRSAIVPEVAAGVPASTLRTVDVDADIPWTRAIRSGEPVVSEAGGVVAVPVDDTCLVCTADGTVTEPEVALLEYVVSSNAAYEADRGSEVDGHGDGRPRYALLGEAVAHELNNQLDLALVHLDLVDERDDHLEHVEAALERIDDVVAEVNALVAPGLSVEEISLDVVAEDVWESVATDAATLVVAAGGTDPDGDGAGTGEESPETAESEAEVLADGAEAAADGDDGTAEDMEAAADGVEATGEEAEAEAAADSVETTADGVEATADGVETSTDGDETSPDGESTVAADERLLRLLLSNLFRNAVQHGGDDVRVEVGMTDDGGFYLADDGPGLPDGPDGRLFEWGWSGAERSGVGLALVSLVADRHGWTVESSGEDGARFAFRP